MAEEFEVPSPHEHHLGHVTEHAHGSGDNFAGKIAVMTAIMATVGALFSYQAGSTESMAAMNKNNAAIKKTEAANQWNYYQAKSSRQNLAELAATIPGVDAAKYNAAAERYKTDKEEIRKKAEQLEEDSRHWDELSEVSLHQHHRWAQAMTAIQIAISMAAITLLTRKEWLKRLSYTAAVVSLGLGGLAALHI
jgi:ABC-type multidrug transport system fused ATPase/permease subunit